MIAILEYLSAHLIAFSLEITVLIAVIAVADRLMKRIPSAFRYLLWVMVLVRLAVPVSVPVPETVTDWVRGLTVVSVPVERIQVRTPVMVREEPVTVTSMPTSVQSVTSPVEQINQMPPVSFYAVIGSVWAVIAGMLIAIVIVRWLVMRYVLNKTGELKDNIIGSLVTRLSYMMGLARPVEARVWNARPKETVALAGVLRPRILLPRGMAESWPPDELEPVITHELAHVKRADLVVNWLQVIIQAVFFFHPLVWYMNHRIRCLREEACDDLAISILGGSRKRYVESMLRVLDETTYVPSFGFAAIGFSERRSNIGERIRRIMEMRGSFSTRFSVKSAFLLAFVSVFALIVSCGVASVWRGGEKDTAHADISEELIIRYDLTQDQMDVIKKAVASDDLDLNITVAAIRTSDDENEELLGAVNNVVRAVNRYTGITATMKEVSLGDPALLSCQMAFMYNAPKEGDVSPEELANFKSYFKHGGTLFIEWGDSEETSLKEKRRLNQFVEDVLGVDYPLFSLSRENILNHSFFDFDDGPPTGSIEGTGSVMETVMQRQDQSVMVSNIDYMRSWYEGVNEAQLQFGVNLVVFGALRENGVLETEAIASDYKPIPVFNPHQRPYIVFRNLNNRSKYLTEAFEVEVLDDEIYRIGDEWIDKNNIAKYLTKLRDFFATQSVDGDGPYELPSLVFKRDNELVSTETIINTMDIARNLGFKNVSMSLDVHAPKKIVYIDIMDDTTYYFDELGFVDQADLREIIYSRLSTKNPLFVVSSASPAAGYSEALSLLEFTFKNLGALYTIMDTEEHVYRSYEFETSSARRDAQDSVIEIEVLDDTTYIIGGERVSRDSLQEVFQQRNELVDVSALITIIRYYPAADIKAAEYAVAVAESFGVTNIQMSVEMDMTKDVLIRPYNESYFEISWWQEKSELIPDIFRGLKKAEKRVYVLYETNRFVPSYDKSLEVSYEKSFQNLVSQLKEIDVDYQVLEMKYWSDSAQNSSTGITSAGLSEIIHDAQDAKYYFELGQERQLEQLTIEILDDTTYRVFGKTVSKDDLEQTLQANMDTDVSYIVLLSNRSDLLNEALFAVYNEIVSNLSSLKIAGIDFVEEDKSTERLSVKESSELEPDPMKLEILGDGTYLINGEVVARDDLVRFSDAVIVKDAEENAPSRLVADNSSFNVAVSGQAISGQPTDRFDDSHVIPTAVQPASVPLTAAAPDVVTPAQYLLPTDSSIPLIEDEGKTCSGVGTSFAVVNDSTYLVDDVEVHRDDLEEVVRSKSIDMVDMLTRLSDPFGPYAFLWNTLNRVSMEQAGEKKTSVLNDLVVDVIDENTIRLAEREMSLTDLEGAIADIIDSDNRYRLVICADANIPMRTINNVEDAAFHNGLPGSTRYEAR